MCGCAEVRECFFEGKRVGCLHEHEAHRWTEEDDRSFRKGCEIFALEVSRHDQACSDVWYGSTDSCQNAIAYARGSAEVRPERVNVRTLSVSQSSLMLSTSVRITIAHQPSLYTRRWSWRFSRTHTLCHDLPGFSIAINCSITETHKRGMRRRSGSASGESGVCPCPLAG